MLLFKKKKEERKKGRKQGIKKRQEKPYVIYLLTEGSLPFCIGILGRLGLWSLLLCAVSWIFYLETHAHHWGHYLISAFQFRILVYKFPSPWFFLSALLALRKHWTVSANFTKVHLVTIHSRTSQSSFLILLLAGVLFCCLRDQGASLVPFLSLEILNKRQKETVSWMLSNQEIQKVTHVSDFLKFRCQ